MAANTKVLNISSLLEEIKSTKVCTVGSVERTFFTRLNFPERGSIIGKKIIEIGIRYKASDSVLEKNIEAYKEYILSLYVSKNLQITTVPTPNKNYIDLIIKTPNIIVRFKEFVVKSSYDPTRVEKSQIETIGKIFNNLFQVENEKPFKIKIGGKVYEIDMNETGKNTISEVGRQGNKADMVIKTQNSGDVYISLKDDSFRQWSGVSDLKNDKEIQDFYSKLHLREFQNKSIHKVSRQVSETSLVNKSVYGKDYGNKFGPNNVNHIIIGKKISYDPVPGKDIFILKSNRIYDNGDVIIHNIFPHIQSSYDPERNDLGFKHTRIVMWPGLKTGYTRI